MKSHREQVYEDNRTLGEKRKFKRFMRRAGMDHPVYMAHLEGEALAHYGKSMPRRLQRNPYPPGRRHDAFNAGYRNADPMGEHHGRNV